MMLPMSVICGSTPQCGANPHSVRLPAHQFKHCDFRRRAEADGKSGGSNAAVYVELLPTGLYSRTPDGSTPGTMRRATLDRHDEYNLPFLLR